METTKKKSLNPFLWFMFAIVIPLIIVSSLTILVLSIAGVDVSGWAKNTASNIPIVSSFVTTKEEETISNIKELTDKKIAEKDLEINQLENSIGDLEATIASLNKDIKKLENELNSSEQLHNEAEEKRTAEEEELKQIAASYEIMNSKQAAAVLENIENEIVINILKQLPNDSRGKILEAMEPEKAAEITKMFIK